MQCPACISVLLILHRESQHALQYVSASLEVWSANPYAMQLLYAFKVGSMQGTPYALWQLGACIDVLLVMLISILISTVSEAAVLDFICAGAAGHPLQRPLHPGGLMSMAQTAIPAQL